MRHSSLIFAVLFASCMQSKKSGGEGAPPTIGEHEALESILNRYETLSAQEKLEVLTREIQNTKYKIQNTKYTTLPSLYYSTMEQVSLAWNILTTEFVKKAFTNRGDFFEVGRVKLFHKFGVTVAVDLNTANKEESGYTGLLAEGNPHCIARISLSLPPSPTNIVPGLALKCLIDRTSSVNIMVMESLDGQSSQQIFAKEFSNVLLPPAADGLGFNAKIVATFEAALKAINDDFQSPFHLTADAFAETTVTNKAIYNYKGPYRIIFVPNPELEKQFPMTNNQPWFYEKANPLPEFRVALEGKGKGMVLYDIYGTDKLPDGSESPRKRIGALVAKSNFVASKFGDERLFFRHLSGIRSRDKYADWESAKTQKQEEAKGHLERNKENFDWFAHWEFGPGGGLPYVMLRLLPEVFPDIWKDWRRWWA